MTFVLPFPVIDPVLISFGPFVIRWYALAYIFGLLLGWRLMRHLVARSPVVADDAAVDDFLIWATLGVVLGGRLGYVVFYNAGYYVENPLSIFAVWRGGMSFHGGLLGVLLALLWFSRKHNKRFFELVDFVAPLVPIGLGAGRIGNFINAELWGKATDLPWAMVFPTDPEQLARHPSQLYQFALEGVALFTILWFYSRKPRPTMAVSGLFAICYGCFRFAVEFVRVPDEQLGYLAFDWLTMGQLLCIPMIVFGALLMGLAYRREARTA